MKGRSALNLKSCLSIRWMYYILILTIVSSIAHGQEYDPPYDSLAPNNDLSVNYPGDDLMSVPPPPPDDLPVDTFDALDPELSVNPLTRVNHSAYAASLGPLDPPFTNDITPDLINSPYQPGTSTPYQLQQCYNASGHPQFCKPAFENAAYHKPIEATNTCGDRSPIHYCQIDAQMAQTNCSVCEKGQHPPEAMNDNDNHTLTWWQSETMEQQIQYPNSVNITLRLGKAFEVNVISFIFMSPRPESMAIYKRVDENSEWEPFHFFSGTYIHGCSYGLSDPNLILVKINLQLRANVRTE